MGKRLKRWLKKLVGLTDSGGPHPVEYWCPCEVIDEPIAPLEVGSLRYIRGADMAEEDKKRIEALEAELAQARKEIKWLAARAGFDDVDEQG